MKRLTFQGRLLLAFLAVILLVALPVAWLGGQVAGREARFFMRGMGMIPADDLIRDLEAFYRQQGSWAGVDRFVGGGGRWGMGPGMMGGMMGHMGRIVVLDADGRVVADTWGEATGQVWSPAGTPLKVEGRTVGYVQLEGGMAVPDAAGRFAARVRTALFLSSLGAAAVALVLALALSWSLSRPLNALRRGAMELARGNLSARVPEAGPPEVEAAARAFNRMARALEEAAALRRQMAADVAHELRTPLSVIRGQVEALQDGVFPLTPEALEPIAEKVGQLERLVEDLRLLSLAEAGELTLRRRAVDLGPFLAGIQEAFRPKALAKGVRLELEVPEGLPPVDADPDRLRQVLDNLLANALRHTPEGRTVRIEARREGQGVRIQVVDQGPGIPPEDLPRVFERFWRGDRARGRTERGGAGLGLAIVKGLAEAHGGRVGVESQVGVGSTFWVWWPAHPSSPG